MTQMSSKNDNLTRIYPTYDSLTDLIEFAKTKLPIETSNELYWLVQVVRNTVLKELMK